MLNPAVLGVMVPIIALLIPIVAVLTKHQQRMAEIIHLNNNQQQPSAELEGIRQELRELRSLVNQQMIALDDMRSRQGSAPTQTDVQSRLGIPQ